MQKYGSAWVAVMPLRMYQCNLEAQIAHLRLFWLGVDVIAVDIPSMGSEVGNDAHPHFY